MPTMATARPSAAISRLRSPCVRKCHEDIERRGHYIGHVADDFAGGCPPPRNFHARASTADWPTFNSSLRTDAFLHDDLFSRGELPIGDIYFSLISRADECRPDAPPRCKGWPRRQPRWRAISPIIGLMGYFCCCADSRPRRATPWPRRARQAREAVDDANLQRRAKDSIFRRREEEKLSPPASFRHDFASAILTPTR